MPSEEVADFTVLTTPAAGDLIPIVDVSDTTDSPEGTTKAIAVSDLVTGAPPAAHATEHQNGGSDELDVTGLSGLLADPQTPITEVVQDIVGAMFPDVATIDWTYDDATGVVNGVVIGAAPSGAAGGDLGGTYPNPTVAQSSTAFALTSDISPSQITADQNDYNPTSLSTATTLRLNSDAARNVTGLQGGADGRLIIIHNVGSQNLVLKDESTSSTAGNRFALNADVTLGADQSALLQYDSTSSRWRLVAGPSSGGGGAPGGANKYVQFNDAGAFGGVSDFTFDKTTRIVQLSQSNNARIGFSNTAGTITHGCLAPGAVGTFKVLANGTDAGAIYSPETAMTTAGGDPRPFLGLAGQVQTYTLAGNKTLGQVGTDGGSVAKDGTIFTLIFIQDATGGRTLTWNSSYKFPGGTTPTLTTTANAVDIFRFVVSGTGTKAYCIGQFLDVK